MSARELWDALERDQIEVHLQSEVWLEDGRHFGFEALPRWRHPTAGLISGEDFMPSAERTSISLPLARRLVERACQELEGRDGMRPDALVSVAPTGLSESGIYGAVTSALDATGTAPGRLCLEVPSLLSPEQLNGAREAWSELRRHGVRFALDRCGAGAENGLESDAVPHDLLAAFQFDYVRLDRALVQAVSRSAQARRLVAAIARSASEAEAITVADGIETNTEVIAAYGLGCRVAQGPRFGSPSPPRFAPAPTGEGKSEAVAAPSRGPGFGPQPGLAPAG